MRNPGLLISCLALWLSAPAYAQSHRPASRVALHASEIVDGTALDSAHIHSLVAAEILRQGANLASSEQIAEFLSRRPDRSCAALSDAERARCLGDLARGVNAERSVLVTIAPYAGERIILTAQVVSSAGTVLQDLQPSAYPRGSKRAQEESIRTALRDFVPNLKIFEPPPAETLATPLTPVQSSQAISTSTITPPSASERSEPAALDGLPPRARAARRTTGIIVAAAGVILAGSGGFFVADANSKASEFNARYLAGRPGVEEEEELASLRAGANRSQMIGLGGMSLGAAALIGSAVLLFTGGEPAATASHVRWQLSPGSLGVGFPLP